MWRLFVRVPSQPRQHGSGHAAPTEKPVAAKAARSAEGPRQQGSSHSTTTEKPSAAAVLSLQKHD